MGLDGLPTQSDNSIKNDEKMVTVSSPRAQFDIEMPKSKRLVPQLIGLDSQFDTELLRSEKLPREHHNVWTDYTCSQKSILHSYDTSVVNETGSRKMIHRVKNIVPDRAKSPKEIKVVSPTSRKQNTEETTKISRRTRENKVSHLTVRNGGGGKDVKTRAGPASSNAKKVKTPDKKLVASSSSHTGGSMKPILPKAPNKSREKTVSRRNIKSSNIDEIVAHQIQREIIHAVDQIDAPSTEYSATPSDESGQSADWDAESSMDDIRNDFSEFNEALLSTSHAERISSTDGDTTHPSTNEITIKEAEIKDEISLLLLSDQTFLSLAAEFTGIGVYKHLTNQYEGISKAEMKNHKLYLDAAADQLERIHRQQNSLCYTGFQGQKCRVTTYFSLEALLRDVSNGIRMLNGYSDEDTGGTKDSLDMKVERDLRCANPSINGVWDMGWQDWICMEETECFIRDAGEDILSLIIEEAALEMCIH
uniref:DUF4378 domain-containing protein n=1 Tax=Arundo donax TaxID=35708 RepID=A0A0A8YES4_ARUDO